ncbi:LYR family of Fe/S cluster biogenesis protein [Wolffia australiana]
MAPKTGHSGLQKQVLALYRGFLRAARLKAPAERRQIEGIVTAEFRRDAKAVDRKNFLYIEYLLRKGKKQLDQLSCPVTLGITTLQVESRQGASGDKALISEPGSRKS